MKIKMRSDVYFSGAICLIFLLALLLSQAWPAKAKFYPMIIAILGLCFSSWLIFATLTGRDVVKRKQKKTGKSKEDVVGQKDDTSVRNEFIMIGWLIFYVAVIMVFGFWVAIAGFTPLFMRRFGKENWKLVIVFTGVTWLGVYLAFYKLMEVSLFGGLLNLTWD